MFSGMWSLAFVGGFLLFALRWERQKLVWDNYMGRTPGFRKPKRYVARYRL